MIELLEKILPYAIRIPVVLISLTVHEVSHGLMAYRLGDTTARDMGRLSLNPLRHLTLIGSLCMLLFGFGFAKPVPIDTRRFKNPKRDMALTAIAGPLSNFILAFFGVIIEAVLLKIPLNTEVKDFGYWVIVITYSFIYAFIMLNIGLGMFNLIPLPPLDGSRVLLVFLPQRLYFGVMKYEQYIMIGLFALIWSGMLDGFLVSARDTIYNGFYYVVHAIPFLK